MSKKKLRELTVVDVIGAALEQIRTEEGYTDGYYFTNADNGYYDEELNEPGPRVGATCAVGGVEQAIWRLTGKVVTEERLRAGYPTDRHYGVLRHPRSIVSRLYLETMAILNRVALRTWAAAQFDQYRSCPIEQLTMVADHRTVVRAFRSALKEAEKEAVVA